MSVVELSFMSGAVSVYVSARCRSFILPCLHGSLCRRSCGAARLDSFGLFAFIGFLGRERYKSESGFVRITSAHFAKVDEVGILKKVDERAVGRER